MQKPKSGLYRLWVALSVGWCLFAVSGSANAQIQCFPNNPMMPSAGQTCHDIGPPPLPSAAPSGGGGGNIFDTMRAKKAGNLLADGKCDEALQLALRAGDFRLAERVKQMCPAAMVHPQ